VEEEVGEGLGVEAVVEAAEGRASDDMVGDDVD
jgi:hypothetical protein